MSLTHYLIVFNKKDQRLVSQEPFEDGLEAIAAYERKEREYENDDSYEIVLVGADSVDTIRQTHSHYFKKLDLAGLAN